MRSMPTSSEAHGSSHAAGQQPSVIMIACLQCRCPVSAIHAVSANELWESFQACHGCIKGKSPVAHQQPLTDDYQSIARGSPMTLS
jgi:hypothetical protein